MLRRNIKEGTIWTINRLYLLVKGDLSTWSPCGIHVLPRVSDHDLLLIPVDIKVEPEGGLDVPSLDMRRDIDLLAFVHPLAELHQVGHRASRSRLSASQLISGSFLELRTQPIVHRLLKA